MIASVPDERVPAGGTALMGKPTRALTHVRRSPFQQPSGLQLRIHASPTFSLRRPVLTPHAGYFLPRRGDRSSSRSIRTPTKSSLPARFRRAARRSAISRSSFTGPPQRTWLNAPCCIRPIRMLLSGGGIEPAGPSEPLITAPLRQLYAAGAAGPNAWMTCSASGDQITPHTPKGTCHVSRPPRNHR